jgi:hypothetical protein
LRGTLVIVGFAVVAYSVLVLARAHDVAGRRNAPDQGEHGAVALTG